MSTRRDLNAWMTHHPLEALAAAAGLVAVTIVARVNPSPELGFILQTLGAGGAIGLIVAYLRFRDDPRGIGGAPWPSSLSSGWRPAFWWWSLTFRACSS